MVYGFVKQSGGHITVYSEVGKGTTFKLYLKATGARKKSRPDKKTTLDLKVKATGTILLVEDDESVRQFITRALKAKGYTVLEVGDGPSALLVMDGDEGIDLLLTDVVLPKGMSGPEIGKEFEKRYPGKPIIYSSGYTGRAIERNGVLEEGEELLSKPYDLEVLFEWVQARLGGRV
jgi:CheY-like chemotaxis protein